MSEEGGRRPWLAPLGARSPHEPHRVSTPLELFFDLVIVVAVARAAAGLHHALAAGHAVEGVRTYAMIFFGVWWAWVNFTWFASAYDNDDVTYRLLVFLQATGALIFAAGISRFEHGDLRIGVLGYVIMRLALAVQWLRAARADPARRRTDRRYALGVTLAQAAWVGSLFVDLGAPVLTFWILAAFDVSVPTWAERPAPTTWHPHHIGERYGLLTLITLGEAVLSASNAVELATSEGGSSALALLPTAAGGLLIVFACWWIYFDHPGHVALTSLPSAFLWGYGHYFVFGGAAAIGAGLGVAIDQVAGRAAISTAAAGWAVAVPVAVYLVSLWFLHARSDRSLPTRVVAPLVIGAILLTPLTGQPVLFTGLLMAVLTGFKLRRVAAD